MQLPRLFARQHKHLDRIYESGSIAVVTALAFIPISLMLAIVIDAGRSWVGLERLQNGIEAAAVASAQTWILGGSGCETTALSLASQDGAHPTGLTCTTSGNAARGVTQVAASEEIRPLFARLLGRDVVRVHAKTGVKIGPVSGVAGLRPFSLCADNPDINNWVQGGMHSGVTAFITFQASTVLCGGNVSGNWAILDYNGGSNSTSETQGWINDGYGSTVKVGDIVSGNPGIPSASLSLDSLVGKELIVPMFREPKSTGSNANYKIVGFAKVFLISVKTSGSASQRGFSIRFEQGALSGEVGSGTGYAFGLSTWSICSVDSYGNCS